MRMFFIALLLGAVVIGYGQELNQSTETVQGKNFRVINVKLTGKVTDGKTGEPLAGASIYLADEKIGTAADAAGKYTMNNVPSGHHVIEISHTGYATKVEHIEITADTEKDFTLSSVITENQAVIVTGVTGATSIRKSPIPVTSIRRSALLQSGSANIVDALTKIPGVNQLSSGPAISKPIIRGLGYNRVVTINEGTRQEGQQWGDEHGIEIDELSIARAEVLKGPASLLYGSDAMAGVINFITNVPVAEGKIRGNFLTNYQTNNGLFALNGNIAGNKHGFNWNAYGTYKSAGNYKNKFDGRVLNSGSNEKNAGGYFGLNKGWGYSHIIFSVFDQRLGLVEGDRDDATGKFLLFGGTALERIATPEDLDTRKLFTPYQSIKHYKIVSDNSFAIRKHRLKVNLGFQNNLRKEFGDPENPDKEDLFFDLKTLSYNIQWQFPEIKEWHTTLGVNGMDQANRNRADELLIPDYNLFDFGTFLYTQRLFKKATLSGGLRFDNRSIDATKLPGGPVGKSFKRSFANFSGSIGISLEPKDNITLKANIARGFRAPTIAELASNGAHEGTNRYEYGQQSLKSETSLQADAGIELDYEHFNLNLSTFYNNIQHFIFYRKLNSVLGGDSLVNVGGDEIPAFQFDQHNANLVGFEILLDIHPHPLDWLHFENTLSFVRGKFAESIDGSRNIPFIPATNLNSELRASFSKAGKSLRNLYFRVDANNVFDQEKPFTGYSTETPTPGYTLWNAGLGADFNNKKNTMFSLHLAVNNFTDKAYQSHLSRLKYTAVNQVTGRQGVFSTGRNFSIKLNIPLEYNWK